MRKLSSKKIFSIAVSTLLVLLVLGVFMLLSINRSSGILKLQVLEITPDDYHGGFRLSMVLTNNTSRPLFAVIDSGEPYYDIESENGEVTEMGREITFIPGNVSLTQNIPPAQTNLSTIIITNLPHRFRLIMRRRVHDPERFKVLEDIIGRYEDRLPNNVIGWFERKKWKTMTLASDWITLPGGNSELSPP